MRPPDFIVGPPSDPYLLRWFLIPRNRWFNVYLHKFMRSDDDRALHDHPWWSLSLLLKGQYVNHTPDGSAIRRRFSIMLMNATSPHRVELLDANPVWTLFITGPRVREWGFWCPQGWRHWKEFVSVTDAGNETGKGCEE